MKRIETEVTQKEKETPVHESLDPTHEMNAARQFFGELGIPLDSDGLFPRELTEKQVHDLAQWRETTMDGSIEMPTEEIFYRKVLVAVSLWRQQGEGEANYLLGKGAGVEVALQGTVQGREKRPISFPYRTHSEGAQVLLCKRTLCIS